MSSKESELDLIFYPTEIAANILHISERQLRRDVKVLSKKLRGDFGRRKWDRGFTFEQMKILKRYRSLRCLGMREDLAAEHIRVYGVE